MFRAGQQSWHLEDPPPSRWIVQPHRYSGVLLTEFQVTVQTNRPEAMLPGSATWRVGRIMDLPMSSNASPPKGAQFLINSCDGKKLAIRKSSCGKAVRNANSLGPRCRPFHPRRILAADEGYIRNTAFVKP